MFKTAIRNINRKRKYYQRDINFLFGKRDIFRKAGGARIIVYHGLCKAHHTKFNARFITVNTFEKHLAFYRRYFNVVSLEEYYNGEFNPGKFNVCITFDDGLENNYTYGLPLLEKYNMPATFFITSIRKSGYDILWNDFLSIFSRLGPQKISLQNQQFYRSRQHKYISQKTGQDMAAILRNGDFTNKAELMSELYPLLPFKTDPLLQDYWLQMTEEQIKQLSSSSLVTIGSHGHYHNDLSTLSPQQLTDELFISKRYLQNITGKGIKAIAFPYGSYNNNVIKAAEQAGYTQLLAGDVVRDDDKTNLLLRERFTINPYISVNNQMNAIITGRYE